MNPSIWKLLFSTFKKLLSKKLNKRVCNTEQTFKIIDKSNYYLNTGGFSSSYSSLQQNTVVNTQRFFRIEVHQLAVTENKKKKYLFFESNC